MARTVKPMAAREHTAGNHQPHPGQRTIEESRFADTQGEQPLRDEQARPGESMQPYVSLKQRVLQKLRRLTAAAGSEHDRTQTSTMQPHRFSFAAEEIARQRRRLA